MRTAVITLEPIGVQSDALSECCPIHCLGENNKARRDTDAFTDVRHFSLQPAIGRPSSARLQTNDRFHKGYYSDSSVTLPSKMLFCTIGVALGRSNTRRKSELSSVSFSDICDKSLHEVRPLSEVYCIMKASCQIDLYQRDGSGDLTLRNDRTRRPGATVSHKERPR